MKIYGVTLCSPLSGVRISSSALTSSFAFSPVEDELEKSAGATLFLVRCPLRSQGSRITPLFSVSEINNHSLRRWTSYNTRCTHRSSIYPNSRPRSNEGAPSHRSSQIDRPDVLFATGGKRSRTAIAQVTWFRRIQQRCRKLHDSVV